MGIPYSHITLSTRQSLSFTLCYGNERLVTNSSDYSWVCSSAVYAWKRGIWVIVLKRKCLCIKYSNFLAIWKYFWVLYLELYSSQIEILQLSNNENIKLTRKKKCWFRLHKKMPLANWYKACQEKSNWVITIRHIQCLHPNSNLQSP